MPVRNTLWALGLLGLSRGSLALESFFESEPTSGRRTNDPWFDLSVTFLSSTPMYGLALLLDQFLIIDFNYNKMNYNLPASMPSGNYGSLDALTAAYDEALEQYNERNMFNYEQTCKQIFMKGLLRGQSDRAQQQKLMNFKFLKFQMKEKDLKKKLFQNKAKEEEVREMNKMKQQVAPEEEIGFKYITKSRRKMVDPMKAMRETSRTGRQVSQNVIDQLNQAGEYQTQHGSAPQQSVAAQPQTQPGSVPLNYQNVPPPVHPMNQIPESQFMNRFSNDDFVKEQKENLKKIQKHVLEQQIREKRLQKIREKQHEKLEANRGYKYERTYPVIEQRGVSADASHEVMNEQPQGQINYLQNSNNIHEVFKSTPNPMDPLRRNPDALPRSEGSNSRSRTRSPPRTVFEPNKMQSEYQQNFHYQPDQMAATNVAQNMQSQALDFIGVLKDLIADTVQQQRAFNQQMFPQPPVTPEQPVVENFHKPPDPSVPELQTEAQKQADQIQQYIKEIGFLRAQKEELLQEELAGKMQQITEEDQHKIPTVEKQKGIVKRELGRQPSQVVSEIPIKPMAMEQTFSNPDGFKMEQESKKSMPVTGSRAPSEQKAPTEPKAPSVRSKPPSATSSQKMSNKLSQKASEKPPEAPKTNVEDQVIKAKVVDIDALMKQMEDPEAVKKEAKIDAAQGHFQTREQRQAQIDQQKRNAEELKVSLDKYRANEPTKKPDQPDNLQGFDHDAPPKMVRHVVHPLETTEPPKVDDYLEDSNASRFNLAAASSMPRQQIAQDLLNQVRNNFDTYDDFNVGAPPAQAPPLEPHESNKPEYPNPFKYRELGQTPDEVFAAKKDRRRSTIFEHEIRENIDKVMKENYEFEQATVQNLFQRYQQYKPLVTGFYGQDIVQSAQHLNTLQKEDSPRDIKQLETINLIDRMKSNYTVENIDLANKYETIDDNYSQFHGPREGAVDLVEPKPEVPQAQKVQFELENSINQPGQDFKLKQMHLSQNETFQQINDPINLGDGEEELDPENEFGAPKVQKVDEAQEDTKKIQDRILTLKLMFEDTQNLRQQKNFLNSQGENVFKHNNQPNLDIIQKYNFDKSLKSQELGPKVAETNAGNTRMISSIVKEVKSQRHLLLNNQQLQKEFEKSFQQNKDVYNNFEPNLHKAAEDFPIETIKQPIGPAVLPEDHPLQHLQNDFKFDFNEYDQHKNEIQNKAIERNQQADDQIKGIVQQNIEKSTILEKIDENSKDMKIQSLAVQKGLNLIAGTPFTYKPVPDVSQTPQEDLKDRSFTQQKAPNYQFLARNVFFEKLGDPGTKQQAETIFMDQQQNMFKDEPKQVKLNNIEANMQNIKNPSFIMNLTKILEIPNSRQQFRSFGDSKDQKIAKLQSQIQWPKTQNMVSFSQKMSPIHEKNQVSFSIKSSTQMEGGQVSKRMASLVEALGSSRSLSEVNDPKTESLRRINSVKNIQKRKGLPPLVLNKSQNNNSIQNTLRKSDYQTSNTLRKSESLSSQFRTKEMQRLKEIFSN